MYSSFKVSPRQIRNKNSFNRKNNFGKEEKIKDRTIAEEVEWRINDLKRNVNEEIAIFPGFKTSKI
jgi:hypothetical protein